MGWQHYGEHRTLHAQVRAGGHVIDSLQVLLHIQVVDMVGFRTLCYIKIPTKAKPGGDSE